MTASGTPPAVGGRQRVGRRGSRTVPPRCLTFDSSDVVAAGSSPVELATDYMPTASDLPIDWVAIRCRRPEPIRTCGAGIYSCFCPPVTSDHVGSLSSGAPLARAGWRARGSHISRIALLYWRPNHSAPMLLAATAGFSNRSSF